VDLNQVTVPSTDVARSIEFYSLLGLKLIVRDLPRYARFECPDGRSSFSVQLVERVLSPSQIVVYFECADLDQRVLALEGVGLKFESEPADEPWLWREAYLRDPDSNNICLFRAGTNRLNPPWRLA